MQHPASNAFEFPPSVGRRLRAALLAGLLSAAVMAPQAAAPVLAQDANMEGLAQRLQRMERDLRDLQTSVYRGGAAPSGGATRPLDAGGGQAVADLTVRMTQLESQITDLTGRIEQLGFQMRTLSDRVERLIGDVDFRLKELEGTGGAGAATAATTPSEPSRPNGGSTGDAPGATAAVAPPASAPQGAGSPAVAPRANTLPAGTPMDQYNFALSLVRKAELDDAEGVLRAFLDEHPSDTLAGNAQFWLAEVHYQRKQYDDAARLYLEGYQRYPENVKAPDMLLKLGMTLQELGQPAEACGVFEELTQRYPQADNRIRAKLATERQRANCS